MRCLDGSVHVRTQRSEGLHPRAAILPDLSFLSGPRLRQFQCFFQEPVKALVAIPGQYLNTVAHHLEALAQFSVVHLQPVIIQNQQLVDGPTPKLE